MNRSFVLAIRGIVFCCVRQLRIFMVCEFSDSSLLLKLIPHWPKLFR